MTTVVSTGSITYTDSLHRVNMVRDWTPDYYERKIRITACKRLAYVITGVNHFSDEHQSMLEIELQLLIAEYRNNGFLNKESITEKLNSLLGKSIYGADSHLLVIFKNDRYLISDGAVTLIPPKAILTLGTGSAITRTLFDVHYESDEFTPEQLLSFSTMSDGLSCGPWVRLRHEILKDVRGTP